MHISCTIAWLAGSGMLLACGGGQSATVASTGGSLGNASATPSRSPNASMSTSQCSGSVRSTAAPGGAPVRARGLKVPSNLTISTIANVDGARELAALPNGDLLVGTSGTNVYIVANAEGVGPAAAPRIFAAASDAPVAGVAFSQTHCTLFIASQHGIYSTPYRDGDLVARSMTKIASVRSGPVAPNSDGDVHITTSLAATAAMLYAGVGSSCNACIEVDSTRATIQKMKFDGSSMSTRATRIRNPIALAVDPVSQHLWTGDAGQDALPSGHPYEFLDDVSAHSGMPDYGWPECEEDHVAYTQGANCAYAIVPAVEFPAYSTLIGATFYPRGKAGTYNLGSEYAGDIFVARHGSWHTPGGCNVAPEVDVVAMRGDTPARSVDWNDPTTQWKPFVTGFQPGCAARTRIGRPTGIAVGSKGSLFIADDRSGNIYRVRP